MRCFKSKHMLWIGLVASACATLAVIFNGNIYGFQGYVGDDHHTLHHILPQVLRTNITQTNSTLKHKTNEDSPPGNETGQPLVKDMVKTPCQRQVQIWRGWYKRSPDYFDCPGLDCKVRLIEDQSLETMKNSHVVIHASGWNWAEVQKRRPRDQIWAYFTLESPAVVPRDYYHLYNYTITYRSSATFYLPYGSYDNTQPQVSPDDSRNWAEGKTDMVAWMASNCQGTKWRRFDFVKKLSEYVHVDIYGGCGKLRCSRQSNADCFGRISKYKFYLALENNECHDYITEKFWWNALLHDVVPIVHGPPKEDYERVSPPNSFISLQDFSSFDELVDYLNLLNSNDTLYNAYFDWKRQGRVVRSSYLSPDFACKLVTKVLNDEKDISINGNHHKEEMTPPIDDSPSKSCYNASGFPHDF